MGGGKGLSISNPSRRSHLKVSSNDAVVGVNTDVDCVISTNNDDCYFSKNGKKKIKKKKRKKQQYRDPSKDYHVFCRSSVSRKNHRIHPAMQNLNFDDDHTSSNNIENLSNCNSNPNSNVKGYEDDGNNDGNGDDQLLQHQANGVSSTIKIRNKDRGSINLTIETNTCDDDLHQHHHYDTSSTYKSNNDDNELLNDPSYKSNTPNGLRGSRDLRSPGMPESPNGGLCTGIGPCQQESNSKTDQAKSSSRAPPSLAIPDFITQTDANGNATSPRSVHAIDSARASAVATTKIHPSIESDDSDVVTCKKKKTMTSGQDNIEADGDLKINVNNNNDCSKDFMTETCETIVDSFRLMCCCLVQSEIKDEDSPKKLSGKGTQDSDENNLESDPRTVGNDTSNNNNFSKYWKLLGPIHPDDTGKKCLVLDLDETLVHSSFRAVEGADFVIPVQIEDVVHFVYVMKRPGVDEFLVEMSKFYEIVIYTASLNKYADPLLDLLDQQKVIRYRLFRESCVFYEGNYVKDLSVLDRDLSSTIIIDNSPNSYLFHPENAIDCTSFIDNPRDRELNQIGSFLAAIRNVKDVRGICREWRDWSVLNSNGIEEQEDVQ